MKLRRNLLLWGFSLGASWTAHATPLHLSPAPSSPSVGAGFMDVHYDPGLQSFSALGYVTDYAGSLSLTGLGTFSLNATITSGGILTSGTLNITGDIGHGVETLLSGTLRPGPDGTAFGSLQPLGGSLFEFQFEVVGGNAGVTQEFGGIGSASGGVVIDAWFENGGEPFSGEWSAGFNNDGLSGLAEAFVVVPEPVSLLPWCLLVALRWHRDHD